MLEILYLIIIVKAKNINKDIFYHILIHKFKYNCIRLANIIAQNTHI